MRFYSKNESREQTTDRTVSSKKKKQPIEQAPNSHDFSNFPPDDLQPSHRNQWWSSGLLASGRRPTQGTNLLMLTACSTAAAAESLDGYYCYDSATEPWVLPRSHVIFAHFQISPNIFKNINTYDDR